jgi:hypothetical protein
MSDTTAHQETAAPIGQAAVDKGKGKAVEERPVEIEDESSDDEMNTCDVNSLLSQRYNSMLGS